MESIFPSTVTRVARMTPERLNQAIIENMKESLSQDFNDSESISNRLIELDNEWDIDRAFEAWAGTAFSVITLLGFLRDRRLHALGWVAGGFLLSHALFGFSPPTLVLRRLGFRTSHEIESERAALRSLRGDFDDRSIANFIPDLLNIDVRTPYH